MIQLKGFKNRMNNRIKNRDKIYSYSYKSIGKMYASYRKTKKICKNWNKNIFKLIKKNNLKFRKVSKFKPRLLKIELLMILKLKNS